MKKLGTFFDKLINAVMAINLAVMSVIVFTNVVLRYAFNSGITGVDEISRYLYIWLVFLGAVTALKNHQHINVDLLTGKLKGIPKKVVTLLANAIMLYVIWLILKGSWFMTMSSTTSTAPSTGIPLAVVYASGIALGIGMGVVIIAQTIDVLLGREQAASDEQQEEVYKESPKVKEVN
ncbi:TRAP transporter small permease [Domibacillus indicus]|uniref:TRAP transporter small permease n=1 Tax=Domibacillus indicus TaxID=1437523 RepID=UPI000617CFAD|nr:TRAP transporter small permease [Domibacillus indicus]